MRGDPLRVTAALHRARKNLDQWQAQPVWIFVYNAQSIARAARVCHKCVVAGAVMALSFVSVMANPFLLRCEPGPQP